MPDSLTPRRQSSAPGARAMEASGDGFWELNLTDGSAWFSDWFHQRLQWSDPVHRTTLSDLRTVMSAEAWNELLRKLRAHLEELAPLDTEFQVQLAQGRTEWWHMRGSVQPNHGGHPTHIAGCVRAKSEALDREHKL